MGCVKTVSASDFKVQAELDASGCRVFRVSMPPFDCLGVVVGDHSAEDFLASVLTGVAEWAWNSALRAGE